MEKRSKVAAAAGLIAAICGILTFVIAEWDRYHPKTIAPQPPIVSLPSRPPEVVAPKFPNKVPLAGPTVQTKSTTQISTGKKSPNVNGVGGNVDINYGNTSPTQKPPKVEAPH